MVGRDGFAGLDDGGDDVLVSDDFASNVVSPTYDNNGNNTGDGVYSYTFDGWNRRRLTKLGAEGDALTVQEFAWFPTGRMATRANTNLGVENIAKDGGNITVRHYFAGKTLVEERNGSAQGTRQYLWSNGQLVWMDTNGDPSIGTDTNPDNAAGGEGGESPADTRHFYVYNNQHRIVALTDYTAGGGGNNGRIAERLVSGVHGGRAIVAGNSGNGELGAGRPTSNWGSGFGGSETLPCSDTGGVASGDVVYLVAGVIPNDPCDGGDKIPSRGDCVEGQMRDFLDCMLCYRPCPPGAHWEVRNGYCVCVEDPKGDCGEETAPGGTFAEFPTRNACLAMRCPAGFSAFCDTVIDPALPPISNHFGTCKRCAGECPEGRRCRKITKQWVERAGAAAGQEFIINTCSCNPPPPTPGTDPGGVGFH